ncbi:acetylglutamate kinase [Pararhodonellum marinum]|uniref:acetylglutamate kinase n=1 Tax=Pararhodonellum marinum TaxID=2755358 RepID=UPI00188F814A|nr:acetylglutamate kinase [Pararhodonellum marinum]
MVQHKILIKYGGNAMVDTKTQSQIAVQLRRLKKAGHQIILVHGGGPFINKSLARSHIKSDFHLGQRITSPEAFNEIQKTLVGEVNCSLVGILNLKGLKAVGLSGRDGMLVKAKKLVPEDRFDLGRVGEVESIDPSLIHVLTDNGFTPVVTCIADDQNGKGHNINGDNFAGALAAAFQVDRFVLLTDVDGLYAEYPDPNSIISYLRQPELASQYQQNITGGMIPKIQACEAALLKKVPKAVILNGTKPEQLTDYLLENKPIGTTLTL